VFPCLCRYVTGDKIAASPWITFLWVHTYPLGFYAPAVLPMLFGFIINCMECIGDVTATMEASGLVPAGEPSVPRTAYIKHAVKSQVTSHKSQVSYDNPQA